MSSDEARPPQSPGAAPEWRPRFNPWLITLAIIPGPFMQVLDTSIANVALAHIAGSLSATPEEATWVLTSYLVANAIILPASAWLANVFGRKRFLLACILLFTTASVACGVAPSLDWLVLARILQGLGGGPLQPIGQAILLESFPPARRGVAMAAYGMGVVVAPILGPTLGGWLTEQYTWRWVFYVNVPVGIVAVLLAQAIIEDPPYIRQARPGRIDYLGLGLMAVGLAALQLVLDRGQQDDWFEAAWVRWLVTLCLIALAAFILRQLRIPHPILNLRILRDRNFAVGTALMTVMGVILYSTIALLPLFLQTLMGYSALLSGLTMTPRGVGAFLATIAIGRLVGILDDRLLIGAGLFFLGLSGFMFGGLNLQIGMPNVVWPNVLNGVATPMVFVPLATAAMGTLRNEQMGNAAGIFNLMRNIGGSMGIAAVATLLARRTQAHQALLVSHLTPYDPAYRGWLATATRALAPRLGDAAAGPAALALLHRTLGQQARLLAFMDNFRLLGALSMLAIPFALFLKRPKSHPGPGARTRG